jgi:hypothetical protein
MPGDQSNELVVVRSRGNAWEASIKQRAYELWSTEGNMSGATTEMLLLKEACEAATPGEPPAPVPAASTISRWAKLEDWRGTHYGHLASTLGETVLRLRVKRFAQMEMAADELTAILAGKYRGAPADGLLMLKAIEHVEKRGGAGTLGANVGGEQMLRVEQLIDVSALPEYANETPMERERRTRDYFADEKGRG